MIRKLLGISKLPLKEFQRQFFLHRLKWVTNAEMEGKSSI